MKKIELTAEEKLTIENLKLKIQLIELQKQQILIHLSSFAREILKKYDLSEESLPFLLNEDLSSKRSSFIRPGAVEDSGSKASLKPEGKEIDSSTKADK